MAEDLIRAGLGLLPVLCFLSALLFLDSYKLVKLRSVVLVVALGAIAAGASYVIHGPLLRGDALAFDTLPPYVPPPIEELPHGRAILMLWRGPRNSLPCGPAGPSF